MRLLTLSLLCAASLLAQTPNTLTAKEKTEGWRLLFDGKSLKGWNGAHDDSWMVEDGCIKSLGKPKLREDLISQSKYADFEMTFEWKVAPGSNSGVKYKIQKEILVDSAQIPTRMSFEKQVAYAVEHPASRDLVKPGNEAQVYPVAFEYQVIDDAKHPDALNNPSSRAGALYRMVAPAQSAAKPVGEFNQGRIIVRGIKVEHWLNGVKVVETTLDSEPVRKNIEQRWAPGHPVRTMLEELPVKECPVALQHHGDPAWFRNVKIRPLPASK